MRTAASIRWGLFADGCGVAGSGRRRRARRAGGRGDRGGKLGEQLAVQFGGVFGVDPAGVGVGQGLLVGALFTQAAVQLGQFGGGGVFGGSAATGEDGVGELVGVVVGGVAAGA